jgi:hypothetical protein
MVFMELLILCYILCRALKLKKIAINVSNIDKKVEKRILSMIVLLAIIRKIGL